MLSVDDATSRQRCTVQFRFTEVKLNIFKENHEIDNNVICTSIYSIMALNMANVLLVNVSMTWFENVP